MDLGRRVALVCAAIPCGRVASYGQIAALCGRPRAARQVGQALHRGASDTAHRVVNSQGRLSGAAAFLVAGLQQIFQPYRQIRIDAVVLLSLIHI